MRVELVSKPGIGTANAYYLSNRPPLAPNPLVRLPLGSIRPRGWLERQLELMVEGMTGRLPEISEFLGPENGWLGGDQRGWEEQAYWFRGYHDLAVLTGDPRLLAEARRWTEAVINSQDEDGYWGPRCLKRIVGQDGRVIADLWPHMVMLDALISHHEHTGDPRVITLLKRFFRFCAHMPEEMFIPAYPTGFDWTVLVQWTRAGDMLPHIHWLYNQTGEGWLLDVATRFYRHIMPPTDEWLDRHVVNFTQRFRYPATYYVQTLEEWQLAASEYWYGQHMATWGQQPRGIFAGDEGVRPGYTDPRQGFETCAMVEFAKSFYILGRITGLPLYADRTEDIMLNHFPAAQTPDLKGLHYLTASNQPQLDNSENHEYCNKGRQISYSPYSIYRCCQHNVAMGWPYYVENLWQATPDNGLALWLFAASTVTAKVGRTGAEVTIEEATDYPFNGDVVLTVVSGQKILFPLYIRVPGWCHDLSVALNGTPIEVPIEPGQFVRIERTWTAGDTVELHLSMSTRLTRWPRNGSVTVDRGPLSYSLKIGELWRRCGGSDEWPEWEVLPTTPWNYGLAIDPSRPETSLRVFERRPVAAQPWTVTAAPIEIEARGRRIPNWQLENETVAELQVSPICSAELEEPVTLVPLGCARLRMACLPVIGAGREAQEWQPGARVVSLREKTS